MRTILLLSMALAATTALAQQYRWVDEKGKVHYSDTPPPPSAKDTQKKNLKGSAVGTQESYELTQAKKAAPVTLYTHPDCKDACQVARDVLNKRGIPFAEVVTVDPQALEKLKAVSGGITVPVLVVGSLVEKTVSAESYNKALDLVGYPAPGVAKAREQKAPPPPPPPPALPGTTSVEQPQAVDTPVVNPLGGGRAGR